MTAINEKDYLISNTEYRRNFWNVMRTGRYTDDSLRGGTDAATGGFALPAVSGEKLAAAIRKESVLRGLATVVKAYGGSSRIFARDCDDLATWVPENGSIPIYDSMEDFTRYPVDSHKLAVFVKLDEDFIHDASFDIEGYLTDRLGKNFAKAEDPRMPRSLMAQVRICPQVCCMRPAAPRSASPQTPSHLTLCSSCISPWIRNTAKMPCG